MTSLLGCYWSVMHRRAEDYAYFKRLKPFIFKIMDGGVPDYQWAKDNLPGSLVIARDHSLSEQHTDMLLHPQATGKRHAIEWNEHQKRLGFNKANTLVLGINEPHVWEIGVPEALRLYTIAMCETASTFGLKVGALQFAVGWPANTGPDTPPDWSPYHGVDKAILANNGALICHEYWADQGPNEMWGWWGGRSLKCPWKVPIIIGETGVDMYVKDASVQHAQRGWRGRMSPERYAHELSEYTGLMATDDRFMGCAVFASDFANREWYSFDIEPAYEAILHTPIKPPPKPEVPPIPPQTGGDKGGVVHPLPAAIITQHFGENGEKYARFGLYGHNGVDFGGKPLRTEVRSMAKGIVAYSDFDTSYGYYVRVKHQALDCYSMYCHLDEPGAKAGTKLEAGDTVGLLGNTGNSTAAHLHLEIRLMNKDGTYREGTPMPKGRVDPQTFCIMQDLRL